MNGKYLQRTSAQAKAGEYLWVFVGQAAAAIGALVGVRMLSNALHRSGYGDLALAMTVATFGQQVLFGPLGVAGQRFFILANEDGELSEFFQAIFEIYRKLVLFLMFFNLVFFLLLILFPFHFLTPATLCLAILLSVISGANSLVDGIQNAGRHRRLVAFHQACLQWLRYLLALGSVAMFGSSSSMALIGYIAAACLVMTSQIYFLQDLLKSRNGTAFSKEKKERQASQIKAYILPFIAWGVFSWVQFSSDRWALACFATKSAVGTYAVLYQFGFFPLLLITNAIQQLMSPILFQCVGDWSDPKRLRDGRRLMARLNIIVAFGVFAAVLISLFLYDLLFSFLGSEYRYAASFLPKMVLSGGLFAAGQVAALGIIMSKSTSPLMPVKIVSGILGTTLSFLLAYINGLDGVIFASILSSAIYYVWVMIIVSRRFRSAEHQVLAKKPLDTFVLHT